MELRQIEIFVAAAESGSFSAAAERLYISHSTVSRAISALEAGLGGVRLFARGSKGVELTDAGRALLTGGAALLAAAEDLERQIRGKGEKTCKDEAGP